MMDMIETLLKDYVQNALGVSVYFSLPESVPNPGNTEFIVMERTGSSFENMLMTSTFAFQSYGNSIYDAADLNKRVLAAVFNSVELDEITRVHLDGDYNFTSPTDKRPRYQAVFDITHYVDF